MVILDLTGSRTWTSDEVGRELSTQFARPIRYEPATTTGYMQHLTTRHLPTSQILVQTAVPTDLRRNTAAVVASDLLDLPHCPPRSLTTYIRDHLGDAALVRAHPERDDASPQG